MVTGSSPFSVSVEQLAEEAEREASEWLAWKEIGGGLRLRYDAERQEIDIQTRMFKRWSYLYEVDTERATTGEERWSWIRQLSGKLWATRELVGAVAEILFLLELGYLKPKKSS